MNKRTVVFAGIFLAAVTAFCYESCAQQGNEYRSTVDQALDTLEQEPGVVSEGQNSIPEEMPRPAEGKIINRNAGAPMLPAPVVVETAKEEMLAVPYPQAAAEVGETQAPAPQPQAQDVLLPSDQAQVGPSKPQSIIDVLELKDMEIADVLKLISKKSGLNIVAGQDIRGKITIYLKDVDVRDALRIILESNNMAYVEEGGILKVMTGKDYELTYGRKFGEKTQIKIIQLKNANAADVLLLLTQMKSIIGKVIADDKSNTVVLMETPEKIEAMEMLVKEIDVPIKTKMFELSYSQAEDLSKKITEVLTKNVGSIKFDVRSNRIVVTDTPQKLEQIENIVKAFDTRHEEVLIKAKIAQIVLKDQYKMGVNWEAIVNNFHKLDLTGDFNILGTSDKRGKLSIGTLSQDDYTVLLEALDIVGVTNILASPHITAINNQEAKILVGSTEPYVTSTTTTPATGPATTAESVNFIDVGVKLYVTPTIHKDNFITMKIKPEVSSVTSYLPTSQNNKIPIVETSQAETVVMVKNGVTIVIGGLIKDEKVETINKVPLLGDLPLLGFAFRNKDRQVKKTELVIFLTPEIMTGDVQADTSVVNCLSQGKVGGASGCSSTAK
ncbi:MAG TPA: secretin N-terminal domain-containing protein [Candidatus Omnitrophota bacterium]|nr:secretin N-terminal domain-containing protein [Candidatus Omnitrophota bacterium]HPD84700.1 secretin N-terminal domain-containing protein [Candidatus Omnitrophota bacterium]HRZ03558.1 secretin N-terminal domain-containing protein [Candidatus Omnitrophota bacterium]